MVLLLDTNICIYLIREKPRSILERFKKHAVGDIGISAITLAELEYGVSKSSKPAANKEALDQFVAPLELVGFDRSATAVYGKLRTTLEKKGQSIGAMDLLIAAHALALNVRLVTHNVREFARVPGLRVETWE
jgi:tRNA(fMet)-specific endonuclease VapC